MGAQHLAALVIVVIQAKVIALLVGASGVGLFGLLGTLLALAQTVFGLGVYGSGVREIAAGADVEGRPPADVARILLETSLALALAGALVLLLFRGFLTDWSLEGKTTPVAISFMAVALIASQWSNAQMAVIQGLRRLRALASARITAAALSAVICITIVYYAGESGVAPAYAATAFCGLIVSSVLWHKLRLPRDRITMARRCAVAGRLLTLGAGFTAVGLFSNLSAYTIRAIIAKTQDAKSLGLFQAAWMISTFYATIVAQALEADFLPRLSAAATDRAKLRRLTDEQTEAGLILTAPGLFASLVLTPWLIRIFYTSEFLPAAATARWMLLGMLVRSAGWPSAYIPLAINRPAIVAAIEAIVNGVLVVAALLSERQWGLEGVGLAYLLSAGFYTALQCGVARRVAGAPTSFATARLRTALLAAAVVVTSLLRWGGGGGTTVVAIGISAAVCLFCAIRAFRMLDADAWIRWFSD